MDDTEDVGISKRMFIAGLLVAILASTLISAVVVTQLPFLKGPKGDKGDPGNTGQTGSTGATGATGPQGPGGPPTIFTTWTVTWYNLTTELQFDTSIGTSLFPSTF